MTGQTAASAPPTSQSSRPEAEEFVLATEQLVKIYGGRAVVNGIDIKVRAGEIVGLLGPNGAGKTTSFYMIVGLVRPNSGRVIFSGHGRDAIIRCINAPGSGWVICRRKNRSFAK